MKKLFTIIIICSAFALNAQTNAQSLKPLFGIGITAGVNNSNFSFSETQFADYKQDIFINFMYGLAGEIYFSQNFSIRPRVHFAGRGSQINDNNVSYMLTSKNIDFALPVTFTAAAGKKLRPFVYAAPVFESTTGGIIGIADKSVNISDANHSKTAIGITPGAGLKFMFSKNSYLSLEAGYHLGLTNTFASDELNGTSNALNIGDYNIAGTRKNRAAEIMISFIFVINKKEQENNVIVDKQPETHNNTNIVIVINNPDTVETSTPKDNYTVDEIEKDIESGKDVTNRKITFNNIEFEFNKSDLRESSKQYLSEIVDFMTNNKNIVIQINGHTDNIGSKERNLELSVGRAKAVYEYLISTGIEQNRLSYKGFGDTLPISSNDTDEGRAKNRRVEFQILSQ